MDNRGYVVDYYGNPPPTVVYERPRPEYIRYKKRSRDDSSDDSSSTYDRYNVEYPPDGGVRAWLIVLACAVLHICSELVYYVFFDTIQIARVRNARLALLGETPKDTYMEFMVFEDVRLGGEFIAAVVSVFVGYRVVAVFGSVCVLGGFLGASFVTPSEEIELMGFLVGFLGGLGVSFWRFAAFVAVMEYFTRHRMTAIILSGFGRVIGILVGYGILARPYQDARDPNTSADDLKNMTEWPTYFQCQCAMAGVGFLFSLILTPLPLVKSRRGHDCAVILRIRDERVCRGSMLLLLLAVYFLYYFGESLPATEMIYFLELKGFSTEHILGAAFGLACGVLLGYILLPFWPLKKKLYGTLLWMGLYCLFMGLITLQLPAFFQISYVAAYSVLFAASQVLFESVLRYVIPIAFGRQYIRWVEGLLGLVACGSTVANNFIANALRTKGPEYQYNVYYFAGAAFLAAGILAVGVIQLAICLKFKDKNYERPREYPVYEQELRDYHDYKGPSVSRISRREPSHPYYISYRA